MKKSIFVILLVLFIFGFCFGKLKSNVSDFTPVFYGNASQRVITYFGERSKTMEKVFAEDESYKYAILIVKQGDKYYLKNRHNIELQKSETEDFIIYRMVNRVGYIKVIKWSEKKKLGYSTDYMLHITFDYTGYTIYGNRWALESYVDNPYYEDGFINEKKMQKQK